MSKREKTARVATDGGAALGQNPFGSLSALGDRGTPSPCLAQRDALPPPGHTKAEPAPAAPTAAPKARGRLDIKRVKAGRGGKTVTLVSGFVGLGTAEKNALCKRLRSACGCGGTVNAAGAIEIQGDQHERLAALLRAEGFTPVLAGG